MWNHVVQWRPIGTLFSRLQVLSLLLWAARWTDVLVLKLLIFSTVETDDKEKASAGFQLETFLDVRSFERTASECWFVLSQAQYCHQLNEQLNHMEGITSSSHPPKGLWESWLLFFSPFSLWVQQRNARPAVGPLSKAMPQRQVDRQRASHVGSSTSLKCSQWGMFMWFICFNVCGKKLSCLLLLSGSNVVCDICRTVLLIFRETSTRRCCWRQDVFALKLQISLTGDWRTC